MLRVLLHPLPQPNRRSVLFSNRFCCRTGQKMADRRDGNSSPLIKESPIEFDMDRHVNSDQNECNEVRSDREAVPGSSYTRNDHVAIGAPMPRLRPEANTSLVVMCVLTGVGLIVMCIPFMHGKHSTKTFLAVFYTVRNIATALPVLCGLVVFIRMTLRVEHLHEEGFVLWPKRCRNCLEALIQMNMMKLHDNSTSGQKTSRLDKMSGLSQEESTLKSSTASNVTINITYIFSVLVLLSIFTDTASIILCFNEHSYDSIAETNMELIGQLIIFFVMALVVYFVSCHFIPNFYDAYLVATPKIRWTFVFFIEMSIWTVIKMLVRPFNHLGHGGKYMNHHCALNSTSGEFLKGIIDISQPFLVELPVMITWVFIDMWFRFVPPVAQVIIKDMHKVRGEDRCMTRISRRSNWTRLWSFYNSFLTRQKHSTQRVCRYSSLLEDNKNKTVGEYDHKASYGSTDMMSVGSHNGNPSNFRRSTIVDVADKSSRALSRKMEIAIASTLLICIIYFGISNLLLAEGSGLRGRYRQWVLRMTFFTPEPVIIFKQTKITRKCHGIYCTERPGYFAHGPSEENKKMLLLTLSGACLYEMCCLVSSFGNLFSASELSHDEIVLNVVSVFAGFFGVLRKCSQTIFLLRVQHQQPRDYQEAKWTMLCLIAVGMTNATQWMWDSLIHEVGYPLAWPVLALFFDGKIGLVIGMIFVPFLHWYELHAATMAYEVYKLTWDIKCIRG